MMRYDTRLRAMIGSLLIGFLVSLSGCPRPIPETIHDDMTTHCVGHDCVSVSQGLLLELGEVYAQNIRLRDALRACETK